MKRRVFLSALAAGSAAAASHERMYRVAEGREKPFNDAPEYLEKLFI